MRSHRETMAICKPTREAYGEIIHAGTLFLDFQTPDLWENKCLLLKPFRLWYFFMAALANEYRTSGGKGQAMAVVLVAMLERNGNGVRQCFPKRVPQTVLTEDISKYTGKVTSKEIEK